MIYMGDEISRQSYQKLELDGYKFPTHGVIRNANIEFKNDNTELVEECPHCHEALELNVVVKSY
jgi:hypothetical protein